MRLGTLPIEEAFSMPSLRCSPILRSTFQTRRQLLAQLASLPLASCIPAPNVSGPLAGPTGLQLVDAHCHLFNITDLPAASFSQIVFFHDHEKKGGWNPAELALREALEGIEAILSTGVTTAAREAQLGPGLELFEPQSAALSPSEEQSLEAQQRKAEAALAQLPRAEELFGCDEAPGPSPSLRSIVTWLRDLRARRSEMTRRLAAGHATSGYNSRLLCRHWWITRIGSSKTCARRFPTKCGLEASLPQTPNCRRSMATWPSIRFGALSCGKGFRSSTGHGTRSLCCATRSSATASSG
jgi:hypothetical protein